MINFVITLSLLISGTLATTISFDPVKPIDERRFKFAEYRIPDCNEKESVNLSNLQLKNLPRHFIKSEAIESLILANNSISEIPRDVINDIPNLQCLNLANNRIPFHELFTFGHDRLTTLILRDQLENEWQWGESLELRMRSFKFPNVSNLDLSGVNFVRFENDFNLSFPRLQNLYLNDRPVTEVFQEVFQVLPSSLRTLHLRNNSLERLDFTHLENIEELYVDGNPLGMNTEHYVRGKMIHTLSLSNCKLWTIDSTMFSGIPNLRTLDLSSNKIGIVQSNVFEMTRSLESLTLSGNLISEFPNFDYLPYLRNLFLNNNRIEDISWPIRPRSLKRIFLRGNFISTISEVAFSEIDELHELDLSNNQLTTLPLQWSSTMKRQGMKSLRYLYLNDNQFKTIADMSIQSFPNLRHLFIKGNDCKSINDKELAYFPEACIVYVI